MILNSKKLRMFEEFMTGKENLTASEIARRHKLNQKSTYLFMEELEKEALLTSTRQGKNKLYNLNKNNPEALMQFLSAMEHLRTLLFYQKHPKIKQIMQKILPNIKGITIVFGSYAKGREKETSDIDLFISGTYNEEKIHEITSTYRKEINIKHQKTIKDSPLTREIKTGHIILKGTEEWIRSSGA